MAATPLFAVPTASFALLQDHAASLVRQAGRAGLADEAVVDPVRGALSAETVAQNGRK